jgi:hypothetical protein
MPLPPARQCRHGCRAVLAALIAVGLTACAEEPPAERYTGEIEAQQEKERLSLKDTWDNGTTVHRAAPPPAKIVYAPPPEPRAAPAVPAMPRVVAPAPPPAKPAPAKPAPPDLAISAPPAVRPPPAPVPKALTESDLQQDTARCGVGVDCLALLRAMIADPSQSWMMRAPTPMEFSNGTRLFAYRALRKTLDCGKLRFASAELDWALDTFGREVDGMQPAQRARVAALAGEVRAELQAEIKQRC